MNIFGHTDLPKIGNGRAISGLIFILAGAVLFIDRYLQTGWLSYIILPVGGVYFYLSGIRQRNAWTILAGGLLIGVGVGIASALSPIFQSHDLLMEAGLVFLYTGFGWLLVLVTTGMVTTRPLWWCGIPAGVMLGIGYSLVFGSGEWEDFIFPICITLGLAFLTWGLAVKKIGLVIPGCLLFSSGLAVYFAWQVPTDKSPLVSTGIMLVWSAFGWLLITLSGRILVQKFIWWPLIPGGIIAMVGWGLYIGGDPDNAIGFISNTGSIGLMIFGLYLLLMRKGIHH
jgi:hypothetical protein